MVPKCHSLDEKPNHFLTSSSVDPESEPILRQVEADVQLAIGFQGYFANSAISRPNRILRAHQQFLRAKGSA